jgi:uncharacterized repeat protein (TIGR01451 family)
MKRRCSAIRTAALLLTVAALGLASTARASHVAITVDGNLADLIAGVNANLGPSNGGFSGTDPLGDTYTGPCAYVNGYDLRAQYILVDFKDAMGNETPNDITLYAGWQVEGVVGDVDGDGNPNTFDITGPGGSTGCALSDETGIGPNESYNVLLDLDCAGGVDDIRIQIKNGQVFRVVNAVPTLLPAATFAFTGGTLELKVPHYEEILDGLMVTTDLCDARFRLTANAEFDGPGEDFSSAFQLELLPSIDVEKTPGEQAICAGDDVTWTITVTNDGLCRLDDITVTDVLGAGLTYKSSDNMPTSVIGQTVTWVFTGIGLMAGQTKVISLTASTGETCTSPSLTNDVTAEGIHISPCVAPGTPAASDSDMDSATVECRDKPPCEIDGPNTAAIGGSVTVTTMHDPATYMLMWSVIDPDDICNITSPSTMGVTSIDIEFTGAGACTVQLAVKDPVNPETCITTCTHIITVNPGGEACPHTIGFWRQQCAQRGNGSTKVCKTGMENLWRCVITETDVISWKKNDGSTETTASLAALSNAALFDALCSQLNGPRPMTIRDMAELQYLGLMLNVCSGALPLNIEIAGFDGTVGEAIDVIEAALNSGNGIGDAAELADDINNRIGVLAEDCELGDDLFRNLPGCVLDEAPGGSLGNGFGDLATFATRPTPNPVTANVTSIEYVVPSRLESAPVSITIFDVSGRAIRSFVPGTQAAGRHAVDWDLRDADGASVTNGIYFYRLTVGSESITEKLLVVRQ